MKMLMNLVIIMGVATFFSYFTFMFVYITNKGIFHESDIDLDFPSFNKTDVARTFAESLTFKTLTHKNAEEFGNFVEYLKRSFPKFHSLSDLTELEYGLLYEWRGSDETMNPSVFLSHIDIVDSEKIEQWKYPPFGGEISDDGFIYGRGALDDKIGVVGTLQALEILSNKGYFPRRTIILCFSMDEELIEWNYGAKNMSSILRERGIEPFFVMDEAGCVVENSLNHLGISHRVGVINIAEKGVVKVNVSIDCGESHATFDQNLGCIEHMSLLVQRIRTHKFNGHARSFLIPFLDEIMPFSKFTSRLFYSLMKSIPTFIFEMILDLQTKKQVKLNKAIRSTFNFREMYFSSHKRGFMVISIRLHPDDSTEEILSQIRDIAVSLNPKNRINLSVQSGLREAEDVSCVDCEPYRILKKSIEQVYGRKKKIIVSPYLNIAGSDLFYYRNMTRGGYNFSPIIFRSDEDFKMIHGKDEKISVDDYELAVRFYISLLLNL